MSLEFQSKLEDMLWKPHKEQIARFQYRLKEGNKDEKKILVKVEEMI